MTIREKAHKLVDELPESELGPVLDGLASRGGADAEMARAPASWGWDKTSWGEPMPNVVAWVQQSRAGH